MVPLLIELMTDPYAAARFNAGRSPESFAGFGRLEYDFVGGPAAIREAQYRAISLQRAAGGTTELPPIFEGCDASVIEDLFRARDERRVHLEE